MAEGSGGGVSRAAAALLALGSPEAAAQGGLGVVRVAELVGGDKGQVSRLLRTLAEAGLVERDPDTLSYCLGWQFYTLAARAGDQRLVQAARPILAELVQELGERVSLSVLKGIDVLTVLSEPPPQAVQATDGVGRTVPAYCTSAGQALLLDASLKDLDVLFDGTALSRLAPNTPAAVAEFHDRLLASRARGFTIADEESEPGLIAAGAPVRDHHGRICAALNVSAPKFRLGHGDRIHAAGTAVATAAQDLSALLGSGRRSSN